MVVVVERYDDIHFRIISGNGTAWNVVGNGGKSPHDALGLVLSGKSANVDAVAILQAAARQIAPVHEDYVAPAEDPAIAIVEPVYGRIILVMAADRGEDKGIGIVEQRIFVEARRHEKIGLAVFRVPAAE